MKEKSMQIVHNSRISLFLVKFLITICLRTRTMSRLFLLILWIFSGSGMLLAQNYVGSGNLEATSSGNVESVQYISGQLGAYLNSEARALIFEIKTTSFFNGLEMDQRAVLAEVWQVSANPLMYFSFDLKDMDLAQASESTLDVVYKLGELEWKGKTKVSFDIKECQPNFSWSLPVRLSEIGLSIPTQYQDRMSDTFTFRVTNFALIQR